MAIDEASMMRRRPMSYAYIPFPVILHYTVVLNEGADPVKP